MNGTIVLGQCQCSESKKPHPDRNWEVIVPYAGSGYSIMKCHTCDVHWRLLGSEEIVGIYIEKKLAEYLSAEKEKQCQKKNTRI